MASPGTAQVPPTFVAVDVSVVAGTYSQNRSWSANVFDVDRDGWQDFLFGTHGDGPARLYLNDHQGHFKEVNAGTFRDRDRHDCDFADVNQDGLTDMYCAIGAHKGTGVKENELWIQQRDKTFVDRINDFGDVIADRYGRGRNVTFIDVNHDPYPDLFVGNVTWRKDGLPTPNRLFLNKKGTSFVQADPSTYRVTEEIGAQCARAVDYNGDGWDDLLVCGQIEEGLQLYRNDHGRGFTNVNRAMNVGGYQSDAWLIDMNGDRRPDLVGVNDTGVQVQLQGSRQFAPPTVVWPVAGGRALALGDADNDGDADVYVVQEAVDTHAPCRQGNLPDLMVLNDGDGLSFTRIPLPLAADGCGDTAAPLDYNRDGAIDFIVLNGYDKARGPVQLFTLVGATA